MDNDERKLLDVLLAIQKDSNERITRFIQYMLISMIAIVLSLSLSICYVTYISNRTMTECTKLYFVTDYGYPDNEVTQTQTIGDIK